MAELKRANVSGDCPAIRWFDSFGVGIHDPVALRDDVEKMADRRLAQAVDVIGRRHRKTALNHHPITFTCAAMADGAVNLESLPAALQKFMSNGHRQCGHEIRADLAG